MSWSQIDGSVGRWSSSGGAENDKNKKVNEIVRALVGSIMKGGDIVVASDSKSKLWRDLSLNRAIQNWNMKCINIARSPGSALTVFTSSERLANQLKINEIGDVGKLVKKIKMGAPKIGKLANKNDMKVEALVKKIQMNDSKVGKVRENGKIKSRGAYVVKRLFAEWIKQ